MSSDLLVAAMAQVPRVLADPGPAVQLAGFGADGLDLTLVYWVSDIENGQGNVLSDINLAVLATLRAAGVEIPYPQRVMHAVAGAAGVPAGVPADVPADVPAGDPALPVSPR